MAIGLNPLSSTSATSTLPFLQERLGKTGNWYFEIARSSDDRPVQPDRERKSLGSETISAEDLIIPLGSKRA
jgi:DNA polymerase IV